MSSLGVLADHLLVCQSLSHHHLHVLAVPLDKESYFVCLFAMTFLSAMMWVLSFSLPIPHGMHLVVPTHSYLFGWYVIQVGHFPLKEPEQELQNRFSPFPTARPCLLTSNSWLHHLLYWLGTGWWCLSPTRASLPCISKICPLPHVRRGLEACLHILPPILGFLWHEPFSSFSFFRARFLWGLGFYLIVGFSSFNPFF